MRYLPLCLFLLACGAPRIAPNVKLAPLDAGERDAGDVDAGPDASDAADRDAGDVDAGSDAGIDASMDAGSDAGEDAGPSTVDCAPFGASEPGGSSPTCPAGMQGVSGLYWMCSPCLVFAQCPDGPRCLDGTRPNRTESADTDAGMDCPSGSALICEVGFCATNCTSNDDCADGFTCYGDPGYCGPVSNAGTIACSMLDAGM